MVVMGIPSKLLVEFDIVRVPKGILDDVIQLGSKNGVLLPRLQSTLSEFQDDRRRSRCHLPRAHRDAEAGAAASFDVFAWARVHPRGSPLHLPHHVGRVVARRRSLHFLVAGPDEDFIDLRVADSVATAQHAELPQLVVKLRHQLDVSSGDVFRG